MMDPTVKTICHCGHDRDTHFERGAGDCLGVGCNDCPGYRDSLYPDTLIRPKAKPSTHPAWCQCASCNEASGK